MQRKILIVIAFLAFGFSLLSLVTYAARESAKQEEFYREQELAKNEGGITFSGPYCFPDGHPQFLLLCSLFLGINLIGTIILRRSIWSVAPAFLSFSIFPYWYYWTQNAISVSETVPPELLDRILYRANEFDLIVCTLVSASLIFHGVKLIDDHIRPVIVREPRLP